VPVVILLNNGTMSRFLSSVGLTLRDIIKRYKLMFKSVFAAVAAAPFLASAALAGPYVNVETNAGWTGDDYTGATTDAHVGYEGSVGDSGASYYVQGGPAIVSVDGEELSTRFSGKAGVGIPVTDALGVYGEVSFITAEDEFLDDLGVGGKLGVKYNF
jgi:predicted heme/steroid binding protein